MTAPSVTYTFTNGTTSDATQVNQNFTDLVNAASDGTKSFTISGLTISGLTASQLVATDAAKALTSTVSGLSPTFTALTLTGALSASGANFRTSALSVNGAATDRGFAIYGATAALQIQIDSTRIQGMNNATPSAILVNSFGGNVTIGSSSTPAAVQNNGQSVFNGVTSWVYGSVSGGGTLTLDATTGVYYVDSTAGATTLNLPAAAGALVAGRVYTILKTDASANTVTIDGNAAETIDGAATVVLGGNVGRSRLTITCDGTNWRILELYEEGTYTAIITGGTTAPTRSASYTRNGKQISIRCTNLFVTSNTTACTLTGMPSHIFPASTWDLAVSTIRDNTLNYPGIIRVETTGVLTLSFHNAITTVTGTFTNSGSKGIDDFAISYTLQ